MVCGRPSKTLFPVLNKTLPWSLQPLEYLCLGLRCKENRVKVGRKPAAEKGGQCQETEGRQLGVGELGDLG